MAREHGMHIVIETGALVALLGDMSCPDAALASNASAFVNGERRQKARIVGVEARVSCRARVLTQPSARHLPDVSLGDGQVVLLCMLPQIVRGGTRRRGLEGLDRADRPAGMLISLTASEV